MATFNNPFTPTFGIVPPYMAGRTYVIEDIVRALDRGPGDPNLATIFIGARGTGKRRFFRISLMRRLNMAGSR